MGREFHHGTKMSDQKLTRAGSVKPLKLSPRRDFGPAQDFPRRQYSLKASASVSNGGGKKVHLLGIRKKKVSNNTEDVLTTVFSTKVIFKLSIKTYLHRESSHNTRTLEQQDEFQNVFSFDFL